MKTEEEKTAAVEGCTSFEQLEAVIKENAPFISNSRETPIEWTAGQLLEVISDVRNDIKEKYYVTRANGLRSKVTELLSQ